MRNLLVLLLLPTIAFGEDLNVTVREGAMTYREKKARSERIKQDSVDQAVGSLLSTAINPAQANPDTEIVKKGTVKTLMGVIKMGDDLIDQQSDRIEKLEARVKELEAKLAARP